MLECFSEDTSLRCTPLIPVRQKELEAWLAGQTETRQNWIQATEFEARTCTHRMLPTADGRLDAVVLGVESARDLWAFGHLPPRLPPGDYRIEAHWAAQDLAHAALGWALGAYRFTRYKSPKGEMPRLALNATGDLAAVQNHAEAIYRVRDLINTPPEDMMPQDIAAAVEELGAVFGASVSQLVGQELLEQNYPTIHAVGRASLHPPRLLDLRWGDAAHPKVTLVGKGVCFDSGGLDLKSAAGMRLMKKDMGGAAHVIGLAQMIMHRRLPVRLRVLIPAVENAVAGNAFHPGDIIRSRAGISVEIENTDAEGRLILCDALSEAGTEDPTLTIDFATLTGAARVALGTELPAFFTNDDKVAAGLVESANAVQDPMWRLPLHKPYREQLSTKVADILNSSTGSFGGAITAALFLQEFVKNTSGWVHLDLMAWNTRAQAGRPKGGEAMGLRAVFDYLDKRFG
ncbi:MAG: leucyl aminopeptidase family protein [Gammaproteobacteria bacterium]